MPNFKKMYFYMFNGITDAIEYIESFKKEPNTFAVASLINKLKQLQIDGEDMYIDTYDESPEDDDDEFDDEFDNGEFDNDEFEEKI